MLFFLLILNMRGSPISVLYVKLLVILIPNCKKNHPLVDKYVAGVELIKEPRRKTMHYIPKVRALPDGGKSVILEESNDKDK